VTDFAQEEHGGVPLKTLLKGFLKDETIPAGRVDSFDRFGSRYQTENEMEGTREEDAE
jgi:hypothetical protein